MWWRDGRSCMRPWLKAFRGCRRPCMTTRRCSGPAPPAACSCWPRRSGTGGCCREGCLEVASGKKGGQGEGATGGMGEMGGEMSKGVWRAMEPWGTRGGDGGGRRQWGCVGNWEARGRGDGDGKGAQGIRKLAWVRWETGGERWWRRGRVGVWEVKGARWGTGSQEMGA